MKILVCGAGAIGSNLVRILAPDLKGEHEITVLDKDKVEERNVTPGTQFYTSDQIGLPKVEALQYNIYKWYQREISFCNEEIGVMKKFNCKISTYDLLIDCFDNYLSRKYIQEYKQYLPEVNLLHIGFSPDYTFAIEWAENYKVPSDIMKGIDICEMPGAAAFVARVAAMGTLVVEEYVHQQKKVEIIGNRFTHNLIK